MKRYIPGLLVAAVAGAIVGYLIFLWRGNTLAPYICSISAVFLHLYRIRQKNDTSG